MKLNGKVAFITGASGGIGGASRAPATRRKAPMSGSLLVRLTSSKR